MDPRSVSDPEIRFMEDDKFDPNLMEANRISLTSEAHLYEDTSNDPSSRQRAQEYSIYE